VRKLCRENPRVSESRIRAYVLAELEAREDREFPETFRAILEAPRPGGCPGGHALRPFKATEPDWLCDRCKAEVPRGGDLYGCRDCDFDLCRQCMEQVAAGREQLQPHSVKEASLALRCHCGGCRAEVHFRVSDRGPPSAIRCFCRGCRRFHTSAFAALLPFELPDGPSDWTLGGHARLYRDTCAELGEVDRVVCVDCSTKLATLPAARPQGSHRRMRPLLALGAVQDESIPESWALHWQEEFESWGRSEAPPWWGAEPMSRDGPARSREVRGGCACGACQFAAAALPGEAQHCYCSLCRRLSGSACMTWLPCSNTGFRWTKREALRLVRTTKHGQRHICSRCAGVLTIIYDAQPDHTWPVAGALDDASMPVSQAGQWYRVIHICCSMMQPWYRLPADRLPRLRFAG